MLQKNLTSGIGHTRGSQLFQAYGPVNVQRVRGPPNLQLLLCDNCCTCTEQKWKQQPAQETTRHNTSREIGV